MNTLKENLKREIEKTKDKIKIKQSSAFDQNEATNICNKFIIDFKEKGTNQNIALFIDDFVADTVNIKIENTTMNTNQYEKLLNETFKEFEEKIKSQIFSAYKQLIIDVNLFAICSICACDNLLKWIDKNEKIISNLDCSLSNKDKNKILSDIESTIFDLASLYFTNKEIPMLDIESEYKMPSKIINSLFSVSDENNNSYVQNNKIDILSQINNEIDDELKKGKSADFIKLDFLTCLFNDIKYENGKFYDSLVEIKDIATLFDYQGHELIWEYLEDDYSDFITQTVIQSKEEVFILG